MSPYLSMESQSLPLLELRVERAQDELILALRAATPEAILAGLQVTFAVWGNFGDGALEEPEPTVYRKLGDLAEALMARDALEASHGR